MRNFKMVVEYDGTDYCGWQRQENGLSIQQVLEETIRLITQEKVTVIGSGRTDAGVHALNQVASFRSNTRLPAEILYRGINGLLPQDIVVKALEEVASDFHAQRGTPGAKYMYTGFVINAYALLWGAIIVGLYHYPAGFVFDGTGRSIFNRPHDFSSFCATGSDVKDRQRTVTGININRDEDGLLEITVEAQGFLKYMVRNIVGTLVEIGRGKRPPEEMKKIIDSRDRNIAGITAPARGLYLKEVKY